MNRKQYRKIVIVVLMIGAAVLIGCAERLLTGALFTQQVAAEWSEKSNYAQISCFFSRDAGMTENQVIQTEQSLKNALQEAAQDAEETGGRLLVDCYSRQGELTLYSDRASITARAFGVGGDFFTFHPLKLLSGNYFDGDDLNKDGVVIDENVAWQLFGSNNVSGMYVEIDGIQYPIRGVVRSDRGYFSEAAKEEDATVYVSFPILQNSLSGGSTENSVNAGDDAAALDSYEILIRNPVQEFGVTALKEALGMKEEDYELVENSSRYDLVNRFQVLRNFGIRSMNTKMIVFPYWENRARAYEDTAALLLVLELMFLVYPVVTALKMLHTLWKRKGAIKEKAVSHIKAFFQYLPVWIKNSRPKKKIKEQ